MKDLQLGLVLGLGLGLLHGEAGMKDHDDVVREEVERHRVIEDRACQEEPPPRVTS